MLGNPIHLLVDALIQPSASFVLGAGASAPHVPTVGQLPAKVAPYASLVRSFTPSAQPASPLRELLAPMIEEAQLATTMQEFYPAVMTTASIATVLEHLISNAHWQRLPQYAIFSLLPLNATIISFNWDGLARARCPQQTVIHPHGIIRPRLSSLQELEDLIDSAQMYDRGDAHRWILPTLVMPGGEESPELHSMRERVLSLWLEAPVCIVVGYSFGLGSRLAYDRVWLDTFVEAFQRNRVPIHFIGPDAASIREQVADRVKRQIGLYCWSFNWHALTRALLASARMHNCRGLSELRVHEGTLERLYKLLLEQGGAAT
jgi:hypothetical protein